LIYPEARWQWDYRELGGVWPCVGWLNEICRVIIEIIENVYVQVVRIVICIESLSKMRKSRSSESIYLPLETIALPGDV
jgi:hypothetical protein